MKTIGAILGILILFGLINRAMGPNTENVGQQFIAFLILCSAIYGVIALSTGKDKQGRIENDPPKDKRKGGIKY